MNYVVTGAALVGGGVWGASALCTTLYPPAMAYFGVIVPGVGTMHAAGGVAATLQATGAAMSPYVTPAMTAVGIGSLKAIRKMLRS